MKDLHILNKYFALQAVPQRVLREERRSPSEQDFSMNNNRQQQHSPNSESAESEVELTGEQQIRFERQQRNFMMDLLNKSAKVVQVTYPRTANNEKELSVSRGEYLEVIDDTRKWWRARNIRGIVGYVPHTIVAQFEPPPPQHQRGGGGGGGGRRNYY